MFNNWRNGCLSSSGRRTGEQAVFALLATSLSAREMWESPGLSSQPWITKDKGQTSQTKVWLFAAQLLRTASVASKWQPNWDQIQVSPVWRSNWDLSGPESHIQPPPQTPQQLQHPSLADGNESSGLRRAAWNPEWDGKEASGPLLEFWISRGRGLWTDSPLLPRSVAHSWEITGLPRKPTERNQKRTKGD